MVCMYLSDGGFRQTDFVENLAYGYFTMELALLK